MFVWDKYKTVFYIQKKMPLFFYIIVVFNSPEKGSIPFL